MANWFSRLFSRIFSGASTEHGLSRGQAPFTHGAGSTDIEHPSNIPLDRGVSVNMGNGLTARFTTSDPIYYEKGSGSHTINAELTVKGKPSATGYQLIKDKEASSAGTAKEGSFKFKITEPKEGDENPFQFWVEVTNSKGTCRSNRITFQYVDPIYYTLFEQEEDMTENLNERFIKRNYDKLIVPKEKITFDGIESNYMIFAFLVPSEYGEYKTITGNETISGDTNKWNYTPTFTLVGEVIINDVEYYAYICDTQAEYEEYSFTVKY